MHAASTPNAIAKLKTLANDRQIAFMNAIAARQRGPHHGETSVEELIAMGEDRAAAVAFFKELADAGCGRFKAGRRGKSSRIIWSQRAIEIAKLFIGETPVEEATEQVRLQATPSETGELAPNLHEHRFLLRPSLSISVSLPLDLTREEASRLADFIKSIPF